MDHAYFASMAKLHLMANVLILFCIVFNSHRKINVLNVNLDMHWEVIKNAIFKVLFLFYLEIGFQFVSST